MIMPSIKNFFLNKAKKYAEYFLPSLSMPLFFLWGLYAIVIVRTAWLGDDAFITLRTVDNFIHGYGLTWNVAERVQSYTHPLWMFLLSGLYFFTREAYYTTLTFSILVSLAAFFALAQFQKNHTIAGLSLMSVLFLSKSFVDYSTSGLENPLSHLLLAIFLLLFIRFQSQPTNRCLFALALVAGLATFNRMDTLLLYLPPLLWALWQKRFAMPALRLALLGFLPFIIWTIFSILYYGFPFPNTAYAKLGTNLARMDLLEMGYLYFLNSLHWDPITLTIIAIAIGWSVLRGCVAQKMAAAGLLLYLFYVLWIGGDHMSGRFFSVVLAGSIALLLWMLKEIETKERENLNIVLPVMLAVLAFMAVKSPFDTLGKPDFSNGISDERHYYFAGTGLIHDALDTMSPNFDWAHHGLELRAKRRELELFGAVGMMPFYAGPEVHFIDHFGLADPLLARLPPSPDGRHRVGHFYRDIPEGYRESVIGHNQITHPGLALYYDKLRLITRGPLWSWERFVTIFEINTGKHDDLLQQYAKDVIFAND